MDPVNQKLTILNELFELQKEKYGLTMKIQSYYDQLRKGLEPGTKPEQPISNGAKQAQPVTNGVKQEKLEKPEKSEKPEKPTTTGAKAGNVKSQHNHGLKTLIEENLNSVWNDCSIIIRAIMKLKDSAWFRLPVDPIRDNVPDYLDIIKRPMDFVTIEKKLKQRQYQDPQQLQDDVQLIFDNCYTYNPPGNEVRKAADTLSNMFYKRFSFANIEGKWNDIQQSQEKLQQAQKERQQQKQEEQVNENHRAITPKEAQTPVKQENHMEINDQQHNNHHKAQLQQPIPSLQQNLQQQQLQQQQLQQQQMQLQQEKIQKQWQQQHVALQQQISQQQQHVPNLQQQHTPNIQQQHTPNVNQVNGTFNPLSSMQPPKSEHFQTPKQENKLPKSDVVQTKVDPSPTLLQQQAQAAVSQQQKVGKGNKLSKKTQNQANGVKKQQQTPNIAKQQQTPNVTRQSHDVKPKVQAVQQQQNQPQQQKKTNDLKGLHKIQSDVLDFSQLMDSFQPPKQEPPVKKIDYFKEISDVKPYLNQTLVRQLKLSEFSLQQRGVEMTYLQKRQLSFQLQSLEESQLHTIYEIIQQHQRQHIPKITDGNEIELKVDDLSSDTLWAVSDYLTSLKNFQQQEKNNNLAKEIRAQKQQQNKSNAQNKSNKPQLVQQQVQQKVGNNQIKKDKSVELNDSSSSSGSSTSDSGSTNSNSSDTSSEASTTFAQSQQKLAQQQKQDIVQDNLKVKVQETKAPTANLKKQQQKAPKVEDPYKLSPEQIKSTPPKNQNGVSKSKAQQQVAPVSQKKQRNVTNKAKQQKQTEPAQSSKNVNLSPKKLKADAQPKGSPTKKRKVDEQTTQESVQVEEEEKPQEEEKGPIGLFANKDAWASLLNNNEEENNDQTQRNTKDDELLEQYRQQEEQIILRDKQIKEENERMQRQKQEEKERLIREEEEQIRQQQEEEERLIEEEKREREERKQRELAEIRAEMESYSPVHTTQYMVDYYSQFNMNQTNINMPLQLRSFKSSLSDDDDDFNYSDNFEEEEVQKQTPMDVDQTEQASQQQSAYTHHNQQGNSNDQNGSNNNAKEERESNMVELEEGEV